MMAWHSQLHQNNKATKRTKRRKLHAKNVRRQDIMQMSVTRMRPPKHTTTKLSNFLVLKNEKY